MILQEKQGFNFQAWHFILLTQPHDHWTILPQVSVLQTEVRQRSGRSWEHSFKLHKVTRSTAGTLMNCDPFYRIPMKSNWYLSTSAVDQGPRPNPSGRRRTQFVAWTFRAWHGDLPIHQVQLHQHAHAYPQNMYYTCHMIRLCVKIGYLQNEHGLIIVFPMINTCCAGSCGLAHDTRNINFKTTDYRHWDMKSNLKTPKKIMRFH